MSYCRWSECDVYAYDSCEGGVQFYVAGSDSLNRLCGTYSEAYQYAKELRDKHGLDVPSYAIDALKDDALEEAERIGGPHGVITDLLAENAKLRELTRDYLIFYSQPGCTYCFCRDECRESEEPCIAFERLVDRTNELGIEVPR